MSSTSLRMPWTEEEDEKLLQFLRNGGQETKWSKISSILDINRTGKQCRERFKSHLSSKIKKGDWTPAEDKIIIEMKKKLGNRWTQIAKFLPGRSDNEVKNRCRSIEKNPIMERRSCSKIKPQIIDFESFAYSHFGQEHCIYDKHNDYRPVSRIVAPMDLHQHYDHEVEQASEEDFSVDGEENNPSTGTVIDNADTKIGWFHDDWVDDINLIAQLDILNEEKACDAMKASDEHDFSVDGEENNPSTGTIIDNEEAKKIGWLEDDWWVDDVIQITHQLDTIINEEKACDAMMVTPSPCNPTTPIFMVDNLLHSMFSLINVSYPTLDISNTSIIGSTKPTPRYRTVP